MSILAIALFSPLRAINIEVLLANHLWQSTLFAAAASLIVLLLKKNSAHVRYSVWLAASLKFLLPFSILTSVGSRFAWHQAPALQQPVFVMVQQLSQPFPSADTPQPVPQPLTTFASLLGLWPILLLLVWFCGCAVVLFLWWARWRRITLSLRNAVPDSPRELEALRRVQTRRPATQVKLVVSQSAWEPGILGIFRPLLLLPAGIADRLSGPQLDAVITHELCHVRRRDNLAAALHMLVQALFWFHPLVWWIGARLLDERERACDEEVLESGSDRQVYAESILKICEFCVGSPLACVSRVTGAGLKRRMAYIMTKNLSRKLDFSRKLLLTVSGLLAVAAPVMFGLVNAPGGRSESPKMADAVLPSFEAASVKLNRSGDIRYSVSLRDSRRFTATNITTKMLIQFAYNVRDFQLSGGPDWINSERYDIDAKIRDSLVDEERNLTFFQRQDLVRPMLQSLLSDRFGLKVIQETKQLPIYALVVDKSGPKLSRTSLTPSGSPTASPGASTPPTGMSTFTLVGPVRTFADALSRLPELGRVVSDQTGLKGNYDFLLQWTPADPTELPTGGAGHGLANARPSDTSGPSIFTAIQEQLGLKLESREGPVQVLVIDQIQRPATDTSNIAPPQSAHPQSASASPATTAVSFPSNTFASGAQQQPDNPITCASGSIRYPEGTVIQMGDEPEQMCVRVLDPVNPKNPDAPPKYSPQWIHTSKAIRERSAAVVHIPDTAPVPCSPKASTQKNLCACEGVGDFSQGALVNSAKGSFQLRCKEGKWLQTDKPIQRN